MGWISSRGQVFKSLILQSLWFLGDFCADFYILIYLNLIETRTKYYYYYYYYFHYN